MLRSTFRVILFRYIFTCLLNISEHPKFIVLKPNIGDSLFTSFTLGMSINGSVCALSIVGLGTFKFLYLLLSDSEDDNAGPKKNKNQLGIFSNVCLDNVYMKYLQEKSKNPKEEEEPAPKPKKKSRSRRQSLKPPTEKRVPTSSPRRNSAPKVYIPKVSTKKSKDDTEFHNLGKAKARGRRGSLQPGDLSVSKLRIGNTLNLGGIQEDQNSDDDSLTPSPSPSQSSVKEDANEEEEIKNIGDTNEKENKQNTNPNGKDEELLLTLMKKNVKESEFTPEQKALYDAHDALMSEFIRRKTQRQKIGGLLIKRAKQLKGLLANIREGKGGSRGESDLALKARSNDLQRRKSKNKNRRFSSYATVYDNDKV